MQNTIGNDGKIMVSIVCMTYNHEKYIVDALEGFVNQKTNFKYEVIVHDDASTDRTPQIIREYEVKYPDIIKPILETENQYSQNIKVGRTVIWPKIHGKYIAFCEGDDYWNNIYKLQKQVDFLESHSDYSACVHNTIELNCQTGKKRLISNKKQDCQLCIDELFANSPGVYQTSSMLFRKEYYILPEEFLVHKIGDVPRAVYLAIVGKIFYFKDVMSVYRLYTENSWSSRNVLNSSSNQNLISVHTNIIEMFKRVDSYTNGEFHEQLKNAIRFREYYILRLQRRHREIMENYKDVLKKQTFMEKIKVRVAFYMPFAEKLYRKIRKRKEQ